jgi:hypothetical protein
MYVLSNFVFIRTPGTVSAVLRSRLEIAENQASFKFYSFPRVIAIRGKIKHVSLLSQRIGFDSIVNFLSETIARFCAEFPRGADFRDV